LVAAQPCILCGKRPVDPHHIRFAQKQSLGRKVSDEFTVPLCRSHHRALHRSGSEYLWWENLGIDPLKAARKLWRKSRPRGRTTDQRDNNARAITMQPDAAATTGRVTDTQPPAGNAATPAPHLGQNLR
jgi:hypothetical protein